MHKDLQSVLISEKEIQQRVRDLGKQISQDFSGRELTVISVINGAILFTADILRSLEIPVKLDCVRVSSYRDETRPMTDPEVLDTIRLDLTNRSVLLIDDILDTGRTLSKVTRLIRQAGANEVKVCVLLEKRARREIEFHADYVGFHIPDEFVVGYGLDFAERYRNLPCIGTLKPELQNPPEWA